MPPVLLQTAPRKVGAKTASWVISSLWALMERGMEDLEAPVAQARAIDAEVWIAGNNEEGCRAVQLICRRMAHPFVKVNHTLDASSQKLTSPSSPKIVLMKAALMSGQRSFLKRQRDGMATPARSR